MKIETYIKAINYKIGEGSKYTWKCFGDNARYLDFDNEDEHECYITCVFDSSTQLVYTVEFHDNLNNIAYRWIDPSYREQAQADNYMSDDTEYDSFKIVNVETEDDIIEKIEFFLLSGKYDSRIKVPIDLDDDILFELMKTAHEKDITLNELIGNVIEQSIQKYETSYE